MREYLAKLLLDFKIEPTAAVMSLSIIMIIILTALIIHFILHFVILRYIKIIDRKKSNVVTKSFLEFNLFSRVSFILQGIIINKQANIWMDKNSVSFEFVQIFSLIFTAFFVMLAFYSVVDKFFKFMHKKTKNSFFKMQSIIQSIKLVIGIIFVIYAISILFGKSPVAILSGLGAMSAVLMLIFKDSILGLTAGLQLSSNKMVEVGDWIEMPKYGADGDVIDIGLNAVKVRNWDKTITTIPTYALVSDSFKNWRGMKESGGRRIKRSILIDVHSIKFLDEEHYKRLLKANLISKYLENKKDEIEKFNNERSADLTLSINGRRLTNIGTLRAYIYNYLKNNPKIHQELTIMVRQLSPNQFGLPLEIYCFTATTTWSEYEDIQSDIFDHTYAVLKDFEIVAYQST